MTSSIVYIHAAREITTITDSAPGTLTIRKEIRTLESTADYF